jgi:hypothetical protein
LIYIKKNQMWKVRAIVSDYFSRDMRRKLGNFPENFPDNEDSY